MFEKLIRFAVAAALAVPVIFSSAVREVHAQTASCGQVIQAVNAVRSAYGLTPYETSGQWTQVAQEQSEYQASIQEITHLRSDGSGPGDHSITSENIGAGPALSADNLIYQWADYWHALTMVGFSSGLVGCGVAQGENGYYYYTLVVKNTGKTTDILAPGATLDVSGPSSDVPGTGEDIPQVTSISGANTPAGGTTPLPVITATRQSDGSITHMITSGETVWSIAELYDVSVTDLISLNYLDAENPLIYPGQTLVIRPGYTATPTPTITNTPLPPTRTLRPTRTPQSSRTPLPPTPPGGSTEVPLVPDGVITRGSVNTLGIITLILACVGGAAIGFSRYWTRRKR